MHYFVDGYNLLFEINDDEFHLESGRQAFIDDLEALVSAAKLDVTLVFDGRFREGDMEKSHYRSLEILFSSYGETADELILSEIKCSLDPRLEVVVTRDRDLIYRAKKLRAEAKSPSEFMRWLRRKKSPEKAPAPPKKPLQPTPPKISSKESSLNDHYLSIFEANLEKEEKERPVKKAKSLIVDDYQRWLTAFEERLTHD